MYVGEKQKKSIRLLILHYFCKQKSHLIVKVVIILTKKGFSVNKRKYIPKTC